MHERGLSNQRRSRHRLTPGTVKFAAFHILSLEGSKGLPIVEVVDKVQKSGLRDLTTSRTPEASIAAALSRDSKLFERTAPSTYCVRSPYRQDPGDADAILSTARERIRMFKSRFLDGEGAERNDDSEVDVAEDPEVDDLGAEGNSMKEYPSPEVCPFDEMTSVTSGKGSNEVRDNLEVGMQNGGPYTSILDFEGRVKGEESPIKQPIYITGSCAGQNQEDSVSDEGDHGEPWVQGLAEGEYSDLSVKERLNALCSLIGVALEGNSVRTVLEERLEAANSLKKQMLAEAQLDRRRVRGEYVMQIHESLNVGIKSEHRSTSSTDARHSPIPNVGEGKSEEPLDTGFQQEDCGNSQNNNYPLNDVFPSEGNLQVQDVPLEADHSQFQQSVLAVENSRSQLKSYIGHKAEEMYVYRSLPLGQDRRCNRYWQFTSSSSRNEPGNGRIFVELRNGSWRLINSVEGFDALLSSLDVRGIRESHLHLMLRKLEKSFKAAVRGNVLQDSQRTGKGAAGHDFNAHANGSITTLCADDSDTFDSSTSFRREPEENGSDKTESLKRYHDFECWMRSECFGLPILSANKYRKKHGTQLLGICSHCLCFYSESSNHCHSCHQTCHISDSYFSEHEALCKENISIYRCSSSPLRIRLLKMLMTVIEVSIPVEAFQPSWIDFQRKTWRSKLLSSSSAEDLLQILTLLENGVKQDFTWCTNYGTTDELLACINPPGNSVCHSSLEAVPVLPWIPLTTAAVALRLLEFEASLSYILQEKAESHDHGSRDIKPFADYVAVKSNQDPETAVISNEHVKEANWINRGVGIPSSNRGQPDRKGARERTRGGRSDKKPASLRAVSRKSTGTNRKIPRQVLMWKDGQIVDRGGSRPHHQSIRSRQRSARKIKLGSEVSHPDETIQEKPEVSPNKNQEWNKDRNTRMVEQVDESPSSSGRLLSIDDNGGVEYGDMLVDAGARSRQSGNVLASRSYDMDEDKVDLYDDGERGNVMDDVGDLYVEQYLNGEYNEESNRHLAHDMVSDEEMQSASSDYSG